MNTLLYHSLTQTDHLPFLSLQVPLFLIKTEALTW